MRYINIRSCARHGLSAYYYESFIRGVITGVIIAYVIAKVANIGYTENEKAIRDSLCDAADFAAYYHDSCDESAMDSCLNKRKQAYDLGYHGWY